MNKPDLGVGQNVFDIHLLLREKVLLSEKALITLLKITSVRQQLLSDPAVASTLVDEAERRSGLTCADVEERMAAFIDAEANAAGGSATHQTMSLHVHACPWCYDVYALTHEIIDAQHDGTLPHWPQ